jgi:hypothetical protein
MMRGNIPALNCEPYRVKPHRLVIGYLLRLTIESRARMVRRDYRICADRYNGSAHRPLPEGFTPLPGFALSAQGAVTQIEGTLMADLAGLPAVWPPTEPSAPAA